jgi:hypothetical protein
MHYPASFRDVPGKIWELQQHKATYAIDQCTHKPMLSGALEHERNYALTTLVHTK